VNLQNPRYKWLLVSVLFFASATAYGHRSALATVFPLLRQDLGLSDLQLGVIGSAFLWSYGVGCAVGGFFSDRFSRSRIVVGSLALWSLATLAVAFVHSFEQMVWARIAFGATQCFYTPAALALIADHHGAATRGKAISSNLSGMSVGLILGATFAGVIAQSFGWREVFIIFGIGGLLLAAIAAWVVRDAPAAAPTAAQEPSLSLGASIRLLLGTRSYYCIMAQGMAASMGAWMFWNWLPLYYQETYQMSLAGAGFSGMFMLQATAMIGIMIGGVISDRVGRSTPHRRPLVMAGFYLSAAPLFLVFLLPQPSYVLVSGCLAASSLLRTMGQANENLMMCDLLPPRVRSAAFGIFLFGNVSAGSVAILVAAWIRGFAGLSTAFACIAGLVGVSALAALTAFYLMPGDLARLPGRLARLERAAAR
jgi:sugar phosphate permease